MKYINFKGVGIVIFPDEIPHIQMKKMVGGAPISAGFVRFKEPQCFDKSTTLGLSSLTTDSELLAKLMVDTNPFAHLGE